MKDIATIRIGTDEAVYHIVIPNVDIGQVDQLMQEAKQRAESEDEGNTYSFDFSNERLRIGGCHFAEHYYIKKDNYNFDTPTVNVHYK